MPANNAQEFLETQVDQGTTPRSLKNPQDNLADEHDSLYLHTVLAAQAAEIEQLREQIMLRDTALDATSTQFTISRHVHPESILVYCNRALAEHHGYRREDLIGKGVRTIAPRNWSTERYQEVQAALQTGKPVQFEEEVPRKDGSSFWAGITITPLRDADGQVTHTMSIGADVTAKRESIQKQQALQEQLIAELKERERILLELRTAQKLEAVGRLAAGVAHEINTPIQYVADSLYFLRSAFEDITRLIDTCQQAIDQLATDPAAARQSLLDTTTAIDLEFLLAEIPKAFERTFDGTERVTGIVRAMKEFSHPDASEFSSADINRALQTTLTVASNEYKYVARINLALAPELPQVTCNIGELNQVFLNLIVNAAHAIHDAGKDSSSGEISISTAVIDDCVTITVADNGCGIPQEHIDKIYDPFFTTKELGRGTGQGLSITHSIVVDKHGGEVNATSEVGAGTQFILTIPINGRKTGVTDETNNIR